MQLKLDFFFIWMILSAFLAKTRKFSTRWIMKFSYIWKKDNFYDSSRQVTQQWCNLLPRLKRRHLFMMYWSEWATGSKQVTFQNINSVGKRPTSEMFHKDDVKFAFSRVHYTISWTCTVVLSICDHELPYWS